MEQSAIQQRTAFAVQNDISPFHAKTRQAAKVEGAACDQHIIGGISSRKPCIKNQRPMANGCHDLTNLFYHRAHQSASKKQEEHLNVRKSETYRNEIKSYIVRTGMTMTEVVDYLSDEYGWSRSVPNLSGKLKRGSLRYGEAVELADALGYDIVWQKRKDVK